MDATNLTKAAMMVALSFSILGCGNSPSVKSASYYGQDCEAHVVNNSFLIEWNGPDSIPEEFKSHAIHPGSSITRHTHIKKNVLEETVLRTYQNKFKKAEHEFFVNTVTPTSSSCSTSALQSEWAIYDSQVPDAWSAASNKKGDNVVVAVVDSGVDITHSLLASQIWTNPNEIPNNGIDDDNNGYIDDVHGFDFSTMTPNPEDLAGHGTHVAGIIAGQAGPLGFIGVSPKAQIMPVRFIDSDGAGSVGDAIAAIEYAINNGAKVINASWGGSSCSELLKDEITKTISHGTVFIGSAGNSGKDLNTPSGLEWPAAFQLAGKLTVGSMNLGQVLSSFSNYGSFVDLAAPGEKITSTYPPFVLGQANNQMCTLSGTSMATPMVSGVAALLLSIQPSLTPLEISNTISASVTVGHYGVKTSGKLNALRAVNSILGK